MEPPDDYILSVPLDSATDAPSRPPKPATLLDDLRASERARRDLDRSAEVLADRVERRKR